MIIYGQKQDIKFISRKKAAEKMGLSLKEFKEIAILTNTKPVVAKNKQKFDHLDHIFYRIEDIQKMVDKDAYVTVKKRRKNDLRKQEYIKYDREDKLKNFKEIDFDYCKLVKEKFKYFTEAVVGLNDSLNVLFLVNILFENKEDVNNEFAIKFFKESLDEGKKAVEEFKSFVKSKSLLKYVFVNENGYNYMIKINNIEILWLEPFKKSTKLSLKDFDLSILLYNLKLSIFHLKLTLLKLNKTEELTKISNNIFENTKFYVQERNEHINFVIECLEGKITENSENNDLYIAENGVESFKLEGKYVQPIYIFECLNNGKLLPLEDYLVGSNKIKHVCPFEENKSLDFDKSLLQYISKTKRAKIDEIIKNYNK